MPDLTQKVIRGVNTWDDTDRLIFLESMVNTTIVPKLRQVSPAITDVEVSEEEVPIDSIPF
jgi:hypothetical protein